jgi:AraC-like DNA-binding protein
VAEKMAFSAMTSIDPFQVPERALQAYEQLTTLRVTVHDLGGRLRPFLAPNRFTHHEPHCLAVKTMPNDARCIDYEITRLRQEMPDFIHGRVQLCFAGFVECIVPVFCEGLLDWVLFAGQRRAGAGLLQVTRDGGKRLSTAPWPKSYTLPATINDAEAQNALECLRQLAARLTAWRDDMDRRRLLSEEQGQDPLGTRRSIIRNLIEARHTTPLGLADVAEALGVTISRAGHVVRETCGQPFIVLLTETRIRTAASLLRHSTLSVAQIAIRCGWDEPSQFHRAFRRHMLLTPLQYRRSAEDATGIEDASRGL